MSNSNEKSEEIERKLHRTLILQQTTIEKLEILEKQIVSKTPESEFDINKHITCIQDIVKSNHHQTLSKFDRIEDVTNRCISVINSIPKKDTLDNDGFNDALRDIIKYTQYWRGLFYLVSVIGGIVFIMMGIYSFNYYSLRGNAVKYEYVRKEDLGVEARRYFMEVDSLYDQASYKNFKIKYNLDD
nr:hypothetical protein [uncultured Carboxylicivirga sp.]